MRKVGYVSRLHEKINLLLPYIHLNPPYGNIFFSRIKVLIAKYFQVLKIFFCFFVVCVFLCILATIFPLMFIVPALTQLFKY